MKILLAALFVGLLATAAYAEDRRQFLQQQQQRQQQQFRQPWVRVFSGSV